MFGIHSNARLASSLRRRVRPRIDLLEGRELLATLTVTSPADSGVGTLRQAVADAASGDTINFAPALIGQTITLTTGPIIAEGKSLDILGPGASKLTVSGNDSSGIFLFVQDPAPGSPYIDVTVSGLTLADGKSSATGGAIFTFGANLSLDGDVFRDNFSAGGGAVEALGPFGQLTGLPTVTITDTRFQDNATSGVGGAYESFNVTVHLSGVTALRNTAAFFGGGFVASGPDMTVDDSVFRENVGGAISHFPFTALPGVRFDVSDSAFIRNTRASFFGGAIENGGGISTYRNCLFLENSTTEPAFAQGGAIIDSNGDVTIDGCTFVGNRAGGDGSATPIGTAANGGAVYLANVTAASLTDSTFRDNLAQAGSAGGGAITISGLFGFSFTPPRINLSGLSFANNRAVAIVRPGTGGGFAQAGALEIVALSAVLAIEDTTFVANAAIGGDGGTGNGGAAQGGAINAFGSNNFGNRNSLTLTNVDFVGNRAQGGRGDQGGGIGSGGAILGLSELPTTIRGGSFVGNAAIGADGGIGNPFTPQFGGNTLAAGGAITAFGPLTIDGTAFVANRAEGGDGAAGQPGSIALGGAILGSGLTLNNATFAGNLAVGGRGGAALDATGTGGRGGDAVGGAINTTDATVNGGTFLANVATGGRGGSAGRQGRGGAGGDAKGGAIAIDTGGFGGTLTVNDALFSLNLALGGADGSGGMAGVTGQGLGGAIYNNGATVVIRRTRFRLNRASTSGNNVYGPFTG